MDILSDIRNHIAFITLNRPAALNALSHGMVLALQTTLEECARNATVHAVLIKGAGEKAFCAGGDIRAMHESATTGKTEHEDFFRDEYQLDHYLHRFPKPYVALMDGICMGGGMGVAQAAKLRIVTDRTRIAMPEVGIGLFPDVGGSYFLSRLPGSLGIYLALTGNQIRASDALYAQLADVYLARPAIEQLDNVLDELRWSNDHSADLYGAIRKLASTDYPAAPLAALRCVVDLHFTHTTVAAIMQSLRGEQRPEYIEWAQQAVKTMEGRSPTMMMVSLKQQQLGETMTLADCFRMELGMTKQCFKHGDIIEGVRALIIDKDHSPKWQPARLEEVTPASVDAFFHSPWAAASHPLVGLKD
jgi:enoyl-CoA hydratase/carnithine racemase